MSLESNHIFLADDDKDDCLFFRDAIEELLLPVQLTTVHDGEQLMLHLLKLTSNLPLALFLDLNMPRKNGHECLTEIKTNQSLSSIPVIIFSTSYDEHVADELYQEGAHYYICKPVDFSELKKVILHALTLLQDCPSQPAKQNFLISKPKTVL